MIGWCSWLRGKKSAASSQTFLIIYPFPGNVLSSNGEKKQKAPNPSLPATGESSSGKPALPAGFHASSPIRITEPFPTPPELFTVRPGESFFIRRSSYFIQQDTPLPPPAKKTFSPPFSEELFRNGRGTPPTPMFSFWTGRRISLHFYG
jgi:hypothetical protein